MVLGDNLSEKTVILIPRPGSIIPDLRGGKLPPEGKRVKLNTYWSRRIKDGDVTVQSEEIEVPKKGSKR